MTTKSSRRTIPGTDGATAENTGSIDRTLYDTDGSFLGFVCIFAKRSIYPYRIVRRSNVDDVLGSNLREAVEELRTRKAAQA